jgi:hypothetical protein
VIVNPAPNTVCKQALGSRLFILLDGARGKGAIGSFALFAQLRLALDGHDLQNAPSVPDRYDTRRFVEAFAFPQLQDDKR